MSKRNLVIVWDDIAKQTATTTIEDIGAATKTQCETLIANLVLRTNAGVKSYSIVESYDREEEGNAAVFPVPKDTEFNTVDQKNVYTYKRGGESSTLQFPAPSAGDFEVVPNSGKRLLTNIGQAIAALFGTFLGVDTYFVDGWFKSKK